MTLFLNAPFGVGKTTAANVLVEKVPGAMLYDPEHIGDLLEKLLGPVERVEDFRDYALWRTPVVGVARLSKGRYGRPPVMPVTVWRRDYFDSIAAGLRRVDEDLACLRPTASGDVPRSRILSRPDAEGSHAWCLEHTEVCLSASCDPAFGAGIRTDGRAPGEVADEITEKAGPAMPGRQKNTNGGGTSCPR